MWTFKTCCLAGLWRQVAIYCFPSQLRDPASPLSDSSLIVLLQRFKWVLLVSVPIWFGYGFARDPDNLEWVKKVVSAAAAAASGTRIVNQQHLLGIITSSGRPCCLQ